MKILHKFLLPILTLISLILIYFAGINFGIDFSDSNFYMLTTDNSSISNDAYIETRELDNLVNVEKVGDRQMNVYLNLDTDNSQISELISKYSLLSSGEMIFQYSSVEYYQILSRIEIFIVAVAVVSIVYYLVELKGIGFKRWQVAYYIFLDFVFLVVNFVILLGIISILGLFGLKIDNISLVIVAMALAVAGLFRIYELKTVNNKGKLSLNEKQTLTLVSTGITFLVFMPLFVIWGIFTYASIIIFTIIILNAYITLHSKQNMIKYLFKQDMYVKLLTRKVLQKQW